MSCENKISTPKICSFCPRPAFLRCIDCDTIYCSSICQVADWANHQTKDYHINKRNSKIQFYGSQNSVLAEPPRRTIFKPMKQVRDVQQPPSIIQDRLKTAVLKPTPKIAISCQTDELPTENNDDQVNNTAPKIICESETQKLIDDSSSTSSEEDNATVETPVSEVSPSEPVSPLQFEEKYKNARNVLPFINSFCRVMIKSIQKRPQSDMYYVIQTTLLEDYNQYRFALNNTYNDPEVKRYDLDQLLKGMPKLYVSKFGNFWTRCTTALLEGDGSVHAVDVDTGTTKIINIRTDDIKPAIKREYETLPFCIQAELRNAESDEVEVDDVIEIKALQIAENGSIIAEAHITESDASEENESLNQIAVTENKDEMLQQGSDKRYIIKDIKLKVLTPGKIILSFLDGSKLAEGKICVCQALNENADFFDKLEADIETFIKENPTAGNYKPIQFELVLAKFTDGKYYRGMCKKINDEANGCDVVFVEYGNEYFVEFKNIIKLPQNLLLDCVSRVINFKLSSGKNISEIDIDATIEKFEVLEKFEAYIHDDSKCATISDSTVILKK